MRFYGRRVADDFAARYAGLLAGWYDCVDRIVLNAYYPMGNTAGGFRTWWRRLIGGSDAEADAVLDNTHLMRLAGRFARRVRAWAADNAVPVIDCTAGERKHLIAEEYLHTHSVGPGVFLILVAKGPGDGAGCAPVRGQQRDRRPGQKAHLCESLQLPHHGLPVGAPDDQDGRACAVRRAG